MNYTERFGQIETMLAGLLRGMDRQANKTDELAERIPVIAAYESRVRRLEDAVFNKAS